MNNSLLCKFLSNILLIIHKQTILLFPDPGPDGFSLGSVFVFAGKIKEFYFCAVLMS